MNWVYLIRYLASEISIAKIQKEYANILADNENIERAYKLIRDMFIFTNKRLIQKQFN